MTTHEFALYLMGKGTLPSTPRVDDEAVKETAHLISGSLIYRLYASMVASDYDMEAATEHLKLLHDTQNHYGMIYLVFILCDATDEELSERFAEFAATAAFVPYLADAFLADWLDFHEDYEG